MLTFGETKEEGAMQGRGRGTDERSHILEQKLDAAHLSGYWQSPMLRPALDPHAWCWSTSSTAWSWQVSR